jgi:hypothetical protein
MIRCRSQGSPRQTLFVTILSLPNSVSAYGDDICRVRVLSVGFELEMEFEDHFCIMLPFCCKNRLDTELVSRLDHTANVVTDELGQDFVFHCDVRLAPHAVAELPLNHGETGLHIRALMVVAQELLFPQAEHMVHLGPQVTLALRRIDSERDVRHSSNFPQEIVILVAAVRFVGGRLFDLEPNGRCLDQRLEHGAIAIFLVSDFNGRYAVRQNAGHDMHLYPAMLLVHPSILRIVPTIKLASGKARGIRRELRFEGFQRQSSLHDQGAQKGVVSQFDFLLSFLVWPLGFSTVDHLNQLLESPDVIGSVRLERRWHSDCHVPRDEVVDEEVQGDGVFQVL